jgi:hypothetical protein
MSFSILLVMFFTLLLNIGNYIVEQTRKKLTLTIS